MKEAAALSNVIERRREFYLLMLSRAVRSFGMAVISIVLPLIVAHQGYGAGAAGLIFTAASVGAAVLLFAAGFVGDRIGRKPVLVALAVLAAITTAGFGLAQSYALLMAFAFFGALARGGGAGSGGAWGPFAPVEQPLIAEVVPRSARAAVLGQLSFVGVLAGAVGSLAAALPDLLRSSMPLHAAEALTMLLAAVMQLAAGVLVLGVREAPLPPRLPHETHRLSTRARSAIWRLSLTNTLNGLGVGFLGPFLTYWLEVRYHVGAAALAGLYTLANLVTALPYLGAARLAQRLGSVPAILWTRLVGAFFTACLPLMPTFTLAGLVYILRMMFQTVANPIRQSFVLELVPPEERGRLNAASSVPSQIATAVSPTVGGYLMQALGLIGLPLELAALFQAANAVLFNFFFRRARDPATMDRSPAPGGNQAD
jgi:MFS family permease